MDVVQLGNEERCLFVIVGGPSVLESSANSDDLFNFEPVRTATVGAVTVDVVPYSCEGRDKSSVDCVVVGEGDQCLGSSEDCCSNGGTITCGEGYNGRWHVFLVRVVELARSGLVWVREVFISDLVERSRGGDRHVYWTSGNIWGSRAWRYGEWIRIFPDNGGVVGGVRGIRHEVRGRGRW